MKYIGREYDRVDGTQKLTGEAKYVDDYNLPHMLYVGVVRSTIPHGKVISINKEKAYINGVIGVYTGKDFPGDNRYGFPICDDQILSNGEVKYIGDAIAIVCAESREIAREAAGLVEVTYEELKPVFSPEESKNLLNKYVVKKNIDSIQEKSDDVVLELSLSTKHQEHMYLEPEGALAFYENGDLNVYAPMQSPFVARDHMARIMGLEPTKVKVVQTFVGGGFGGKDDVVYEACGFASLGAYMTKRPCKYIASREESMVSSYKRHPINSTIKLTADKEGKFKSIRVRNKMDGGAYAAASTFVQFRNTTHSAGPYVYDSVDVENEVYYTNNVYCGAFRGFGGLQACFFYDTVIDEMAYKLNMDPIELRLKNIWTKGTTTSTNQIVDFEPSMEYILKRIREVSDWEEKKKEFKKFNEENQYYKKGIGVSLGYHGISLGAEGDDFAQTEVIYLKNKNKLLITSGISELGQGSRTIFSQIASEVLGLSAKFIEVNNYDTTKMLQSGPTVASRGSTLGGNAVINACENFIKFIKEQAAIVYGTAENKIEYCDGKITILNENGLNKEIFVIDFCRQLSKEKEIKVYGRFDMPSIDWNEHNGLGRPYIAYHYGAHVSYITVDMVTGMISVDKYFAIHDIGKILNPVMLKGQINGGVATGLGYALTEDLEIHNGIIENKNYDSYIIPTSMDIPSIYSEAVESNEPIGPFGAKGTGEPVLTPVPACIGNAIRFATGKRITALPFSLEKIVLGKELSKYGK